MTRLSSAEHGKRRDDIETAIETRLCYGDLAALWNVTPPAAWIWCSRHCSDGEREQLAQNGYNKLLRHTFGDRETVAGRTADRIALLRIMKGHGWSMSRIARAMGVYPSAISNWRRANAPDAIDLDEAA